jgi:putative ABC transport system permease protein
MQALVGDGKCDLLCADFDEIYDEIAAREGSLRARAWLTRQLLWSLIPILWNSLTWRMIMITNFLKITMRNVRKNKSFFVINISGLAIGLACCILLALYVQSELDVDTCHHQADEIYILCTEGSFNGNDFLTYASNATAAAAMREEFPEVLETVRFGRKPNAAVVVDDKQFSIGSVRYADASVFAVFTLPMVKGDPARALTAPHSIVLTEETAEICFGSADPVGRTLTFAGGEDFTVTGVVRNVPENSTVSFDALCSFETLYTQTGIEQRHLTEWLSHNFNTYLLLRPGYDYRLLEQKLPALTERYAGERLAEEGGKERLFLQPLHDIYLYSLGRADSPVFYVYIFSAVAVLILLMACFNFMNLSTARAASRMREVSMRKVLGASRRNLVGQFLFESLFFSFLALLIALALVQVILPLVNGLIDNDFRVYNELRIGLEATPWLIPGLAILMVVVSGLAGIYPAVYLARFKPANTLGSKRSGDRASANFRRVLVTVQFAISITLVIFTGIIISQLNYLRDRDPGFDKENVLVMLARDEVTRNALPVLREAFTAHPGVVSMAASSTIPGWGSPNNSKIPEGFTQQQIQLMDEINVDPDFIPTLGLELVAGRNFSDEFGDEHNATIINETAAERYGWSDPVGKIIRTPDIIQPDEWFPLRVIGVVKDFHLHSLQTEIRPMLMIYDRDFPISYNFLDTLTVRIRPENTASTLAILETEWLKIFPNTTFQYFFLEDNFEGQFRRIERSRSVLSYFTLLSMVVACLGLYGMSAFMAAQRTREIGIRKVLGGTTRQLVSLLGKDLMTLVLLANLVAWPVAYYFVSGWLEDFPYRTGIGLMAFLIPALLVLFISLLTISVQTLRAARANPVNTIRQE